MMKFLAIAGAVLAAAGAAQATEFVANGGFETSNYNQNSQFGATFGAVNGSAVTQGVANWVGLGGNNLEFYFIGGTQTTTNATNQFGDPLGYFYPTFNTLSPTGGNFVGLDGDSDYAGQISQSITGLTVGKTYTLNFDWAAAQLINRSGPTTESFQYSLGGDTATTPVVANPSGGFSGWMHVTHTFVASGTSEALTFLSVGTPQGLPPIAALDSVSLTGGVPEPAAWSLMLIGAAGMGALLRRRRALAIA